MVRKVFLIDIDGTICDDIKNEDSHLYPTAKPFSEAKKIINKCNRKYCWLLIDNKQDEPNLKYRDGFFGTDLYDTI